VVIGRVACAPELRYLPSGSPVCSFTITTSRRFTAESGGSVLETITINVDAHRRLGEICAQFLQEDREILVMGTLHQKRRGDPKTKDAHSELRILAHTVQFLGGQKSRDAGIAQPGK
jgi:single-strand DNA-binding protein